MWENGGRMNEEDEESRAFKSETLNKHHLLVYRKTV